MAKKKNITFKVNHGLIRDSYIRLIKQNKRCPTMPEISIDTGMSITTIKKHLDLLVFEPIKHPLRELTDDVLIAIFRSSVKGTPASQKLWLQVMEGWTEKKEIDIPGGLKVTFIDDLHD